MTDGLFIDTELDGMEELAKAFEGEFQSDAPLLIELLIVDEAEIQSLNKTHRGVDRVTDVLSFPSMDGIFQKSILSDEHGEELDDGKLFLGSVVICESRAREQAEEYGHSYARELYYLTVHGILHCLGYDHETDADKRLMREREEKILSKIGLTR